MNVKCFFRSTRCFFRINLCFIAYVQNTKDDLQKNT